MLGAISLTAADVAGKSVAFVITPYLANRMGAAGFGALTLYTSVTQILVYFISLGGPALIAAEYIRSGYTSARRMRAASLRLSLWIAVVLLLASLLVSWCAPSAVPLSVGVLIVAVSYVSALSAFELAYYRGSQIYGIAIVGQLAVAVLNVLLTVAAFEFDSPSAANRLLSIALAGGVVQLGYALDLRRKHYEPADKKTRRADISLNINFGLSIFPHAASVWVRSSVDRFVLAGFTSIATAGIYSVGVSLAMAANLVFVTVNQQLQPFLYRRLKDGAFADFQRLQRRFIGLILISTSFYYLLLLAVFDVLFDSEYYAVKALLPALLAASALQSMYHVFSHAPFYERRGLLISFVTAGGLVVHLLGLGALEVFNQLTPGHVALVSLVSTGSTAFGMTILSHRTVRQLRLAGLESAQKKDSKLP
ncbi:MAG: lipopolysaccharide biosynthesis protein [Mycolicibacterium sp.]|uniref:lipopolysaccharide biosynthesis protein n=1 Tax=Mycolicibacterium sp. TaxID=2320850 RepID=UPI003D0E1863